MIFLCIPICSIYGPKKIKPSSIVSEKKRMEQKRERERGESKRYSIMCVCVGMFMFLHLFNFFFEQVNGEYITACDHDDTVNILRNAGKS